MHLNRDQFFAKLAPLAPPPEIFRLAYLHQYFDHLSTTAIELLWNPLTLLQKKSAINGIFLSTQQTDSKDLKLPESIKSWIRTKEDEDEDFSSFCEANNTELIMTLVDSSHADISLKNLCLLLNNEEYTKVIITLSPETDDDLTTSLRQKLKRYVQHTSSDELESQSDVFNFMAFLDGSVLTHIEYLSQVLSDPQEFKFCVSQYLDSEEKGEFGLQAMLLIKALIKNKPLKNDLWYKIARLEQSEEKEFKGQQDQPTPSLPAQIASNLIPLMSEVEIKSAYQILGVFYFDNEDQKSSSIIDLPPSAWKIISGYLPLREKEAILDYFPGSTLASAHLRKIQNAEKNLTTIHRLMAEIKATEGYPAISFRLLKKYIIEFFLGPIFLSTFPTSFILYNNFQKIMANLANSLIWQMCMEIGYSTDLGHKTCKLPSNQTSIPLNQTQICDQFCAEEVEPRVSPVGVRFIISATLASLTSTYIIPIFLWKISKFICCRNLTVTRSNVEIVPSQLKLRIRGLFNDLNKAPPDLAGTTVATVDRALASLSPEEKDLVSGLDEKKQGPRQLTIVTTGGREENSLSPLFKAGRWLFSPLLGTPLPGGRDNTPVTTEDKVFSP